MSQHSENPAPETRFETLRVEWREDRVVVELHRPEARNAINARMIAELHQVCARIEADPKPLLLTGHGTVFAGGADISELRERGREEALAGINSRLFERLHRLQAPTVAAVDGFALGGGAELSYACDIRIATPSAVFAQPEPGLGIIAGAGACWRLKELVGTSVAKQVLLGGFKLDAEAALRHGLVAEIVPSEELRERAHGLIDRMAAGGAGILIISSEMEELIGLCDRILVMARGEIQSIVKRDQFDRHEMLRTALGENRLP